MQSFIALTVSQLKMYYRDRQSVFLSLFFPLLLMTAFGFVTGQPVTHIAVGIVDPNGANPQVAQVLSSHSALTATTYTNADEARAALSGGEIAAALVLPEEQIDPAGPTVQLETLIDSGDLARGQQAIGVVNGVLIQVEHAVRGTEPLFRIATSDVSGRDIRYIDFLVPGILAFMVMQLAIAGSGFNIVEYKRKGILKRLFVTPLTPLKFISSLITMRMLVILVQLGIILGMAVLLFGAQMQGSFPLFLGVVILGGVLFLGMGFALGGVANTQNAIIMMGNLLIFPQVFLAAVFFPLDSLPDWLQGFAQILPLTFLSHAMRSIANDGASLFEIGPDLLGILVWTVISLGLAVRFFRWGDSAKG